MSDVYDFAYRCIHDCFHLVPARLRRSAGLRLASEKIAHGLQRFASHDAIYDEAYYRNDVEDAAVRSAPVISDSILSRFRPRRVVDLGCGTGALLAAFRDRGCEVVGLEYSEAGLKFCRDRGLDVRKFDIERDTPDPQLGPFDVAICMEVAEHLPAPCADRLVDLLTGFAPVIVFTAATPGQGGVDHVNEQAPEYWIEKFESRGFRSRSDQSAELSREWQRHALAAYYWGNLMVFGQ